MVVQERPGQTARLPRPWSSAPAKLGIHEGKDMAESNLMDNSLLEVLSKGHLEQFQNLLNSEVPPPRIVIIVPSGIVSADHVAPRTGEASPNSVPPVRLRLIRSMLLRRVTSGGDTVLHILARHGHLDLVRAVFQKARIINNANPEGPNGEADEAREGHHEHEDDDAAQGMINFVKLLRAKNNRGETCLHEAIRWGHTTIVEELITGDAKLWDDTTPPLVEIKDDDGASPLYLATTLRRDDIVKYLTEKVYRYKSRLSYDGPAGKTALHAAVLLSKDLCVLLLKWKTSLAKCKDELGRTPLHYLGTSGTDITELILENDVTSGHCKDSAGMLPIHVAASRGRLDIVKILVKKCPDCVSSCNDDDQTFLHVAVLKKQFNIVKYVCTDPNLAQLLNMRDKNGDTALHLAVKNGFEYIFCSLYGNKETCLSFINKEGKTPVDLALLREEHGTIKRKKWWMRNDLLVDGADFCTCRWDHFSSSAIKEPMDEKENEKLSKSAALIAAGAGLILSQSFGAPFSMANKNPLSVNGDHGSNGKDLAQNRAEIFKNLVQYDILSLMFSLTALFFCMVGGFHTSGASMRFMCLLGGGLCLYAAAEQILTVFALGLLQFYPEKKMVLSVLFIKFLLHLYCIGAAMSTLRFRRVFAHVKARFSRLGLQASVCSIFRCPPGVGMFPLFHITILFGLLYMCICFTVGDLQMYCKLHKLD